MFSSEDGLSYTHRLFQSSHNLTSICTAAAAATAATAAAAAAAATAAAAAAVEVHFSKLEVFLMFNLNRNKEDL